MTARMHDIISIGSATRDVFLKSSRFRVIKDARFSTGEAECMALGTKIDISDITFETGGGATNTAVSFARLGYRAGIMTRIGADDSRGQEILSTLRKECVDVGQMVKDKKHETAYSVLLLTGQGERTALTYRGASAHFQARDIAWTSFRAKWIYVTSLAGNMTLLRRLFRFARKKGIRIAFNPGASELQKSHTQLFPLLRMTDILLCNLQEASLLTGIARTQEVAILQKLGKSLPGIVVITAGADGSFSCDNAFRYHSGNRKIRVTDTTGAGDAFGAGFVAAYMRRKELPYALQVGTMNAESVIQHIGSKPGLLHRFPDKKLIKVDKKAFPN